MCRFDAASQLVTRVTACHVRLQRMLKQQRCEWWSGDAPVVGSCDARTSAPATLVPSAVQSVATSSSAAAAPTEPTTSDKREPVATSPAPSCSTAQSVPPLLLVPASRPSEQQLLPQPLTKVKSVPELSGLACNCGITNLTSPPTSGSSLLSWALLQPPEARASECPRGWWLFAVRMVVWRLRRRRMEQSWQFISQFRAGLIPFPGRLLARLLFIFCDCSDCVFWRQTGDSTLPFTN